MSDIFDDPEGISFKEERREKLKNTHPDKGGNEDDFKKIIEEYKVKEEKINDIQKEIESAVMKQLESNVVETDPVKKELNKLRTIEVTHNDPSNPYAEIDVPDSVKLGEKLVINISKKVPSIQVGFGNSLSWKRENKYDPKSKEKLILSPSVLIDKTRDNFNDDKIEIDVGLIKKVGGKDTQIWLTGDYLLEVRVFGRSFNNETSIRKTVKVIG
jgi:hypothetical protein